MPNKIQNTGSFIPTSFSWELSQLQDTELDPKLKSLMVRLYQNLNLMAIALNTKDTGLYYPMEFVCGQQYFPSATNQLNSPRQVFRKIIDFGALPNTATKSVAHGVTINANTSITRIYGAATTPSTSFIPLPFASPTALIDNIQLDMDATNINVTTGKDQTAYTTCYIIIEFLQQ